MPDWKKEIRERLVGLRLAPTREAEIVEELAQYLEDRYEDLLAGGSTEADAWRKTLEELNESELLARELSKVERRVSQEPVVFGARVAGVAGSINMLRDLLRDLRFGTRMLLKSKGFTMVAVLSLGLGIGANTALFSVVDAVLLKTLPVAEPERLVLFAWHAGLPFRVSGMRHLEHPLQCAHKFPCVRCRPAMSLRAQNGMRGCAKFVTKTVIN